MTDEKKTPDQEQDTGPDPLESIERDAAAEDASDAIEGELLQKEENKKRDDEERRAAELGAKFAMGFASTMWELFGPEDVDVPDRHLKKIEEKLVPVMQKHRAGVPAYLKPWQEEIELGMALGGAAVGVAMAVKKKRREEERQAKKGTATPGEVVPITPPAGRQEVKAQQ